MKGRASPLTVVVGLLVVTVQEIGHKPDEGGKVLLVHTGQVRGVLMMQTVGAISPLQSVMQGSRSAIEGWLDGQKFGRLIGGQRRPAVASSGHDEEGPAEPDGSDWGLFCN